MCKCKSEDYSGEFPEVYIQDNSMNIFDEEYEIYAVYKINYCPFCGEKLTETSEF